MSVIGTSRDVIRILHQNPTHRTCICLSLCNSKSGSFNRISPSQTISIVNYMDTHYLLSHNRTYSTYIKGLVVEYNLHVHVNQIVKESLFELRVTKFLSNSFPPFSVFPKQCLRRLSGRLWLYTQTPRTPPHRPGQTTSSLDLVKQRYRNNNDNRNDN